MLFNIPIRFIQQDIYLTILTLESMLEKANPFAVIVTDHKLMKDVFFEKYTPNLKLILYTGRPLIGVLPKYIEIRNWDEFMIEGDKAPQEHWLPNIPEPKFGEPILGSIFMYKNSNVPAQKLVPLVVTFTSDQIMSAIAAQKEFLPKESRWSQKDKMLVFTASCNMYTTVFQLAALAESVDLSYLEGEDVSFLDTMIFLKPTIIICDDFTSWLLLTFSKDIGVFSEATYTSNLNSLKRGTLNHQSAIAFFNPLRLIYSFHLINPYIQQVYECEQGKDLDQKACNSLRALTGSAVIHGLVSPMIAGPICQTTISDYRVLHGPKNLGINENGVKIAKTINFINFGPPMPSLEYNVSDYPGSQLADQYYIGSLQVRGTSTCRPKEIWIDTGIKAVISGDGCVKLMLKKKGYPPYNLEMTVAKEQHHVLKQYETEHGDAKCVVKENVKSENRKPVPKEKNGFI